MRTKQCAIRRVANNSEEDDETETVLTIMPQSPEPETLTPTPTPALSTIINGPDQQQLEDGTVVVQPEAAAETVDSQVGCFDQAASSGTRCAAPGIYDTVKCTACGKKVNPYNGTMEIHPLLKVLVCQKCYKFYKSGHFDSDEQGKENQCRWCGEGGSLICCDNCEHSFCRTCIKRNLGRSALQDIESLPDESVWLCYACDQGSLRHLQEEASVVIKTVKEHFLEASKRSEKQKVAQAKKAIAPAGRNPSPTLPLQIQSVSLPQLQQIRSAQVPVLVAATPAIAYGSVRGGVGLANNANSATIAGMQLDLSAVPKVTTTRMPTVAAVGHQPLQPHRQLTQQHNQLNSQHQNRQQLHQLQQHHHQQQRRQQPGAAGVTAASAAAAAAAAAAANQASVAQRTEQWYKQNVRIETILSDIESVDVRNIGTALNATVSLLQGMMRQYSRFMQDLTVATTHAEKSQIVSRFKSAYRMHLFLRLGKLRSLIAEEDKHMVRRAGNKAAARGAVGGSSVIDLTGSSSVATASRQAGLHLSQPKPSMVSTPLIQHSAGPVVSRYQQQQNHQAKVQPAQQVQQRQTPRQAARPTPEQSVGVPPEMVVVLSDDDDDEENNNNGGGGAHNSNAAGAELVESDGHNGAGGKDDQLQAEAAASVVPTATGGGGKPAAILELLEARRRREKGARKLQQPRRIPASEAAEEAPVQASADASPEAPVEASPDEVANGVGGGAESNDGTQAEAGHEDASPPDVASGGAVKRRIAAVTNDKDDDLSNGSEAGARDADSLDSAPPSEKRPRHQLQELNAESAHDVASASSVAAAPAAETSA